MSKLTLSDSVESYLKAPLKKTTRRAYAIALRQMAKFVGENKPFKSITIDHMLEYQIYMYEDSGLAQATINSRIKAVKRFFNHMIERDVIRKSPAKLLKTSSPVCLRTTLPSIARTKLSPKCYWNTRSLWMLTT